MSLPSANKNSEQATSPKSPELSEVRSIEISQHLLDRAIANLKLDATIVGKISNAEWENKDWDSPVFVHNQKVQEDAMDFTQVHVENGWVKQIDYNGVQLTIAIEPHDYNGSMVGNVVVDIRNPDYAKEFNSPRMAIPYVTVNQYFDLRQQPDSPLIETLRHTQDVFIGIQPEDNFGYFSQRNPVDFGVRFVGSTEHVLLGSLENKYTYYPEAFGSERNSEESVKARTRAFLKIPTENTLGRRVAELTAVDDDENTRIAAVMRLTQVVSLQYDAARNIARDGIVLSITDAAKSITSTKKTYQEAVVEFSQLVIQSMLENNDLLKPIAVAYRERTEALPEVREEDAPFVDQFRKVLEFDTQGNTPQYKVKLALYNLVRQSVLIRELLSNFPVRERLDYRWLVQLGHWTSGSSPVISYNEIVPRGYVAQHRKNIFMSEQGFKRSVATQDGTMEIGVVAYNKEAATRRKGGEGVWFMYTPKNSKELSEIDFLESIDPSRNDDKRALRLVFPENEFGATELRVICDRNGNKYAQFWGNANGGATQPMKDPVEQGSQWKEWNQIIEGMNYENLREKALEYVESQIPASSSSGQD